MQIATGHSTETNTEKAIEAAYHTLSQNFDHTPDLLIASYSDQYDSQQIASKLKSLSGTKALLGTTSCMGSMTEQGFHSKDGVGLGLWAIHDPDGDFGVGAEDIADDARTAAAKALQKALEAADCIGEAPTLIWLHAAPGNEELILQGLADIVGEHVPVFGGSSGDNTITGEWKQIVNDQVYSNAVTVAVLVNPGKISFSFHSGYSPTNTQGIVTKADGRTVFEIDHQPAAKVYNSWTKGSIEDVLDEGGNILAATTLHPLGRKIANIKGINYYNLSHPDSATANNALTLFSNIEEGEAITLLEGSIESLVTRAGRVATSALETSTNFEDAKIHGALSIYCAGCMLVVDTQMNDVVQNINQALDNKPFLGSFTFGEQGCFLNGLSRHGNLMISFVIFHDAV